MPYIKANSIRLFYEQFGDGPPLLLISGTGWSGEHWKLEQVPYFSASYRVIVFDHRGCGRSDRPAERYTTRMFADDAFAMLDAMGVTEPVHVLGHSMGGRVAQWIALDHADRVRSLVLAASGPGPIGDTPRPAGISPEKVAEFVSLGWPGYMEEHLRSSDLFFSASPDTVERFAAAHRGRFGTDLLSYLRHLDARLRHDTKALLSKIEAPTLVIVGSEDNYGSPGHLDASRFLANAIPDTEMVVIPDVAHALHIETAQIFNDAVGRFLSEH